MNAVRHSRTEGLAREYAQAAFEHTTKDWLNGLGDVWDQVAARSDLLEILVDLDVPFAERQGQLDAVLDADLDPALRNFLYVLLRDGQLGLLEDVLADLVRLATQGPEAQVAHVTSAVPLTGEEKEAFRQRIQAKYGQQVDLDFRVDASILGGVIVRVGDKVIDGSITSKLDSLHDRLVSIR